MNNARRIQWSVLRFSELDTRLFHDVVRLRVDIFVVEQNCPYPELDGLDPDALHIIGRKTDGIVSAYARILPPKAGGVPHIGRVLVALPERGQGTGDRLMEVALAALEKHYGSKRSALAAQSHLQKFYAGHGFTPCGTEYIWDGIPHVDMVLDAS
ncbi:MAG: GNAT family N-acetyltransferase [Flavobacteriales bacterium]